MNICFLIYEIEGSGTKPQKISGEKLEEQRGQLAVLCTSAHHKTKCEGKAKSFMNICFLIYEIEGSGAKPQKTSGEKLEEQKGQLAVLCPSAHQNNVKEKRNPF